MNPSKHSKWQLGVKNTNLIISTESHYDFTDEYIFYLYTCEDVHYIYKSENIHVLCETSENYSMLLPNWIQEGYRATLNILFLQKKRLNIQPNSVKSRFFSLHFFIVLFVSPLYSSPNRYICLNDT